MPSCYRLYKVKKVKSNTPLFNRDVVQACYLLTMDNSSRTASAIEEFQKHGLTPELIVQVNKGYKQCAKENLYSNNPAYDLAHALRHVFTDALKNNFDRILVLEDDFSLRNRWPQTRCTKSKLFYKTRTLMSTTLGTHACRPPGIRLASIRTV